MSYDPGIRKKTGIKPVARFKSYIPIAI